ncbi:MAG: glutathione S-transferase [Pseudomonadota bacterium]
MTADIPILYSFRRCPYAMRARLALHASGIACELREVVLRNKPTEMLAASPKGTVPVLVVPAGTVIDESLSIMRWALEQNDPKGWLASRDREIQGWIDEIDGAFKHHLDRYKYPNRFGDLDPKPHREAGYSILQRLEHTLSNHGFLVGATESLADIATFPFVRQFANTDRDWFDALDLPSLNAWLAHYLGAPDFLAIMGKHAPWQGGRGPIVFSK